MSRQNKVNPGLYTQAGRLSPDDAARERRKRNISTASKPSGRARSRSAKTSSRATARRSKNIQTSTKSGSRSGAPKAAGSKRARRA